MDQNKNNNESLQWLSMSDAAKQVPYSAEYLSLLARKKRLPAKKINGVWYTTKSMLQEYLDQQMLRNQISPPDLATKKLIQIKLQHNLKREEKINPPIDREEDSSVLEKIVALDEKLNRITETLPQREKPIVENLEKSEEFSFES